MSANILSLFHTKPEIRAMVYRKGFTYQKLPAHIKKKITGVSYRENPYIQYSDLRYVRVRYYDFSGQVQSGELIVNKKIARKMAKVFYVLYKIKYPIQRMKLVDEYGADDERSMGDNNTSAFNFRTIAGTTQLSKHALGMAVDINPRINPYINSKGVLTPENAKVYECRDVKKCRGKYAKYMIQKNSQITKIFKKYGFSWGGDWEDSKDYQHFEI
ncbi:MAG: M15 family metallopeptidase [Butyribacter sp.]|nr:M15 family metallopeptidase [bacterium]MDY3853878.1 M15 family metallopeptidase [Butyribacter sp.]